MEDQPTDQPLDVALSTEEILVAKNSMPEDDPNGNTLHDAREIRWGPQHAGAKLLASQYTRGKHTELRHRNCTSMRKREVFHFSCSNRHLSRLGELALDLLISSFIATSLESSNGKGNAALVIV